MTTLEVREVCKTYGRGDRAVEALRNINLKISGKQAIGIVGPNGAGKTTLARIISGLETPTKGTVVLDGTEITEPNEKIMMVFSKLNLLPWKTVEENIELALWHLPEKQRKRRAAEYIQLVGLEGFEEYYPKDLSTGLAVRAELARALAREPSVLILDDIFSGLDPLTGNNLRNEILRLYHAKNKLDILILITNNIEEAVYMCDAVFIMTPRPGRIKKEVVIELDYPRKYTSKKFRKYVDIITSTIMWVSE